MNLILERLLDWNDKSEAYTRICLFLFPIMGIVAYLSINNNSDMGIPIIFGLMIFGGFLMFKRVKIERLSNRSEKHG